MVFVFENVIISLMLLIWLLKLLTSFISFFLNQYFLVTVLMGIIYHIFAPFIYSKKYSYTSMNTYTSIILLYKYKHIYKYEHI